MMIMDLMRNKIQYNTAVQENHFELQLPLEILIPFYFYCNI